MPWAEPAVSPTRPRAVRGGGCRSPMWVGACTHPRAAGFPNGASPGWAARGSLSPHFPGTNTFPSPNSQVHIGPSRREESGKACPWQPFHATFSSHFGPCSAGKSFIIGGLRAPRIWSESADLGMFRGKAPGASWSMWGEETPVSSVRANRFPIWPYPGIATWHFGSVPLWTQPTNAQGSGAHREACENKGERWGKLQISLGENTFLTQQGLLKKEC